MLKKRRMECLKKTVDTNVWKPAHEEETALNGEIPATNLCVVSRSLDKSDEERERVKEILHQHYGLTLLSCQRMEGYDDANYLVTVDGYPVHTNLEPPSLTQYVLRIINAQDSQEPERIDAINEVMKHIHAKGIVTQMPVVNLKGQEISFYTLETEASSTRHVVVLRTFLPGTSMVSCALTQNDVFNCGVFVGLIIQAFEDFHHPFFDTFQFSWSVDNRAYFRTMLSSIEDLTQRHLLDRVMDIVDEKLSQIKHQLKRGQVHGDMGTSNIIRPRENQSPGQDPSHQKTSTVTHWGLIDFHDTHQSYRIYELATSAARMMSANQSLLLNRLDIPGHLLAGYQTIISLDSCEREAFPYLVLSNLCYAMAGCHYHYALNPGNGEYLQKTMCNGMSTLESLLEMTPSQAQLKWEQVARGYDKS